MPRLVVMISGTGRNLQAIIDAVNSGFIPARLAAVISNRPGVEGLERAQQAGIPAEVVDHTHYDSREAFDSELAARLESYQPDLIALAGFMRVLTPEFVRRFEGRMFNIHPSLLPKYRGLKTHQRALEAGDPEHGASVHYVTAELDGGPVVLQGRLRINVGDTPEILADRVMQEVELHIYPQVLCWAAKGHIQLTDSGVLFGEQRLDMPLQMDDLTAGHQR